MVTSLECESSPCAALEIVDPSMSSISIVDIYSQASAFGRKARARIGATILYHGQRAALPIHPDQLTLLKLLAGHGGERSVTSKGEHGQSVGQDLNVIDERRGRAGGFQTLGIDSLKALELLTRLENHFRVELPDWEMQGVSDFRTLAERIHDRLG